MYAVNFIRFRPPNHRRAYRTGPLKGHVLQHLARTPFEKTCNLVTFLLLNWERKGREASWLGDKCLVAMMRFGNLLDADFGGLDIAAYYIRN